MEKKEGRDSWLQTPINFICATERLSDHTVIIFKHFKFISSSGCCMETIFLCVSSNVLYLFFWTFQLHLTVLIPSSFAKIIPKLVAITETAFSYLNFIIISGIFFLSTPGEVFCLSFGSQSWWVTKTSVFCLIISSPPLVHLESIAFVHRW